MEVYEFALIVRIFFFYQLVYLHFCLGTAVTPLGDFLLALLQTLCFWMGVFFFIPKMLRKKKNYNHKIIFIINLKHYRLFLSMFRFFTLIFSSQYNNVVMFVETFLFFNTNITCFLWLCTGLCTGENFFLVFIFLKTNKFKIYWLSLKSCFLITHGLILSLLPVTWNNFLLKLFQIGAIY